MGSYVQIPIRAEWFFTEMNQTFSLLGLATGVSHLASQSFPSLVYTIIVRQLFSKEPPQCGGFWGKCK